MQHIAFNFKLEEIKTDGTLFGINLSAIQSNKCPFCGLRLYEMLRKPLKYCKSKECPCYIQQHRTFIINK